MPRSTKKRTTSVVQPPPSSLTMCAPACIRADGAAHGLLARLLVAAKGQIAYHPSGALHPAQPARHALGVVAHGVERHADRAAQALADHAERVAYQQALDPGAVGHRSKGGVVGGEHGDFFAALAELVQARQAHRLARRQRRGGRQGAVGGAGGGFAHGVGGVAVGGWGR